MGRSQELTLKQFIPDEGMDTATFLALAKQVTAELAELHRDHSIHQRINSFQINILACEKQTSVLKLVKPTDKYLDESLLDHLNDPAVVQHLPYMSPEQTGRINHPIDQRSDLYSLGIVLFEMASGRLPFLEKDPLQLTHCHIAKAPPKISDIKPQWPSVLSHIIDLLLEKSADNRYKSCQGLYKDLEHCSSLLESGLLENGKCPEFELGIGDCFENFHIPEKLYGRAAELESIKQTYALAADGNKQIVLLSGAGGTGKTALFDAFIQGVSQPVPVIAAGKFDQLSKGIAYSAIGSAFQQLAKELLLRSDAELNVWSEKLNDAWGSDGRLITDLIPGFTYVAGEQPEVAPLQPEEKKLNFFNVFAAFVGTFANLAHPLILFMDDLQWADSASLELLEFLVEHQQIKHFMLVCAFRDDEIHPEHPAETFFNKLRRLEFSVSKLSMRPLSLTQIEAMLADSLGGYTPKIKALATFVQQKTKGNAFYVRQFLMSLYDDNILSYDAIEKNWHWNLEQISTLSVTSNVVELMLKKIQQFEPQTQKAMQFASMLGNRFEASLLMLISGEDKNKLLVALHPAIRDGLLLSIPSGIRFVHDRVQEAAYVSIPKVSRNEWHLHIARILLTTFGETAQQEMHFNIAQHFLKSLSLLEDDTEKIAVAKYLLETAEKAINSAAWEAALSYTAAAIDELLPSDCWDSHFELTWRLFKNRAYCEYTTTKLEASEENVKTCLAHAKTEEQHVDMHMLYSRLLFQMNRHVEGIQNTRAGLAKLGVALPANIGKLNVIAEFAKFRWRLKKRSAKDLLTIAPLKDQHLLNICRILYDSGESSYMVEPETMAYLGLKMANICIKHGHSIYAPMAYNLVSMVMTGASKEYKLADDFIKMAIELNKRYPDKGVKGRIYMCASVLIWHWNNPIHEHANMVKIASQCSQETGSMHYAYYAMVFSRPQSLLFNDDSLADVIANNTKVHQLLMQYQDRETILQQEHLLSFCHWLSNSEPTIDPNFSFELREYTHEMTNPGNGLMRAYFYCYESYRSLLQNDYQQALKHATQALSFVDDTFGNLICAPIYLFYILSFLKSRADQSPAEIIARLQNKRHYLVAYNALKKIARHNPNEFNSLFLIGKAEQSRVAKKANTITLYEKAILAANRSSYRFIKGIIYEFTGLFYLENQALAPAKGYIEQAIACYREWGANRKVALLYKAHADMIPLLAQEAITTHQVALKPGHALDLQAILQASQVLSKEIEIDQVLRKLMGIVITIAGADKGHLILVSDNELFIRAIALEKTDQVSIEHNVPIKDYQDLAQGVVNYVYRTGETVLLGNAANKGLFKADTYITNKAVKSLMCLPMLRQDKIIGVLYLENRLVENVFTEEHLSVLNALLTQASISLENAELFEQRKQNLIELKRLSLAAEYSPNAILITDTDGCIEYVNPTYLKRSGFQESEILGMNMQQTQLQGLDPASIDLLYDKLNAGRIWVKELKSQSKSGSPYWEHVVISPVMNGDNIIQNILLIKEDITSRKAQEQKILYQAQYDSLTDLPNRILAMDRINQAIAAAHRNQKKCALLFIDLDDFKKINDTQGHEIGDLLLKNAAARLKSCVRENDTVARQGGDEFIIILNGIDEAMDAEAVSEKIIHAFQKPIALHNMHMVITASIGIAVFPDDGTDVITLFRNADAAMYQAKDRGGNTEQFFDPSINRKAVRKLEVERHLRNALEHNELELLFQPVFSVSSRQIIGAEALLRWNSKALGAVYPDEFIPVAEQTGLIIEIGLWVLEQACRTGQKYRQQFNEQFHIAVNVSPRQLGHPNFVGDFSNTLQQLGFPARNLDVEVTEGLFLDSSHSTVSRLKDIKSLGANISMDDFGTGYSSLNYLRLYPFDILKIDRSFVKDLNDDKEGQALVKATIAMAKALELKVVAEGVENAQHLAFIQANQCSFAQGYFLSKPIIESEFEALMLAQKNASNLHQPAPETISKPNTTPPAIADTN